MQSLSLITPPAIEPIDLLEAKSHLRLITDDEDGLVSLWIAAARQHVENWISRQLVAATWRLTADRLPCGWQGIQLRRPPFLSLSSFKYLSDTGAGVTLASDGSGYQFDPYIVPAQIFPPGDEWWPASKRGPGAVTIDFVAGYVTPILPNPSDNTFAAMGRTYANGESVTLSNSGGGLPDGFKPRAAYFVVNATGSTFKLAATVGGSAIDVQNSGTGTHFIGELPATIRAAMLLLIGHLYEHRESSTDRALSEVPMGVDALLTGERWETH